MCVLQEDGDEIGLSTTDSEEEEDDTASITTSIDELTSGAALLLVVSFYIPLPSCRDQHQAAASRAARALTAEPANTKTTVRREDDNATAADPSNRVRERQSES